jgi:hypothetical protein
LIAIFPPNNPAVKVRKEKRIECNEKFPIINPKNATIIPTKVPLVTSGYHQRKDQNQQMFLRIP